MILAGLGAVAYFQSSLTALLVQGVIGERFRSKRMQARIDRPQRPRHRHRRRRHGVHAIEELHATRTPFVAVDRSREVLERISVELAGGELLYVVGDATDDMVLTRPGSRGPRASSPRSPRTRTTSSSRSRPRSLNGAGRIVAKVIAPDAAPKMMRAGANATVSPNMIGGRRLASELVRPTVTEFIDQMLRDKDECSAWRR